MLEVPPHARASSGNSGPRRGKKDRGPHAAGTGKSIVVSVRDRGTPIEYLLAPDEGHSFVRPVNNLATYAETERFLAQYLGARYQANMTPEVATP